MAKFLCQTVPSTWGPLEKIYPYLLPVLLFLAVTATNRPFVVCLAVVCFALVLGRAPMGQLRRRGSLLAAAVVLYSLVYLSSGLWSHFGSYAARESVKMLIALAVFGLLLARTEDKLSGLLWTLDGVLAMVSFLCIDASGWLVPTRGFSALMGILGSGYSLDTIGYETGIRITGIFSNANVSAGMIAFGLVISLYLYRTVRCEKARAAAAVLLGVEALAFFLSFSMGAMAAFAVTCLVYVVCSDKGCRLPLFLLMLECVVVTVVCAFAVYPHLGIGNILPDLLGFVCGGAIWALDRFVGRRVIAVLKNQSKAVAVTGSALAALAAAYVVLAMTLTGGITLTGGERLARAVYPAAGDFTVNVDGTDAHVQIYTQNATQLMMHTNTVLYEGALSDASFNVPEDSQVVWFVLSGDATLNAVTLSDGTKVPLGYKLLPGFAANRLQGLKTNQNFIQRLVFFQDGMKLWKESPFIGWGVGGVEGQLTAVQSFYYESKYIHNQLIQIMDEAGIIGLAAFLFLLGSAIWTLLQHRKEEDSILPMLAACLTMMICHSMTELVWSTQMYQVVVYTIFAVLIIRYAPPAKAKRSVAAGTAVTTVLRGTVLVFTVLQASSLLAAHSFEATTNEDLSVSQFVARMQKLDCIDVYDDSPYQVNAMANSLQLSSIFDRAIGVKCAKRLEATCEFDNCYHVAAYYYLPLRDFDGFFRVSQLGLAQEASNPDAWNSICDLYIQAAQQLEPEELEEFLPGAAAYQDLLDEFNSSGRMEQIELDKQNQTFLSTVCSLVESGADGQTALHLLNTLLAN